MQWIVLGGLKERCHASEQGGRAGGIPAVMGARKVLAYDFFRFVS